MVERPPTVDAEPAAGEPVGRGILAREHAVASGDDEVAAMKKAAAEYAANLVEPGMVVGLGVGSTAIHAVRRLGARYQAGELPGIVCIPCSIATGDAAIELGLPMSTLEDHPEVDLTIDGADEVDAAMNLIKGAGGALLREKIVAQASKREIIVTDASKISEVLGEKWTVSIEVTTFGYGASTRFIESLGATVVLRKKPDGDLYLTDQGNYILDSNFGRITDPAALAAKLDARAGIVEHGLFVALATDLVVATPAGIQHTTR